MITEQLKNLSAALKDLVEIEQYASPGYLENTRDRIMEIENEIDLLLEAQARIKHDDNGIRYITIIAN